MSVADLRVDGQVAFAGAALTFLGHVRAAIDRMDVQRRIERQQPQRNVVRTGADVENSGAARQVSVDGRGEGVAPARAAPERSDCVALVVIGRDVPKHCRDQRAPHIAEKMRPKVFTLRKSSEMLI